MTWMENFINEEPERRRGILSRKSDIPFGPPLDQRTDLHRPAYWTLDISDYPNAAFDLFYNTKNPTPEQKLHLLYPEDYKLKSGVPLPVLVFIHGGAFRGGNSENHRVLYTAQASLYALQHGYAVALVDYRLFPTYCILDLIHDVKAAIRYLRGNAEKLGLDPERIALIGESAGGYLVNICGVTGDIKAFEALDMGYSNQTTTVSAVISWYSIFDVTSSMIMRFFFSKITDEESANNWIPFLSPGNWISKETPPFLLQHGTADSEVNVNNSIDFLEALNKYTDITHNTLDLVDGAEHAVRWFITKENGDRMVNWLDQWLRSAI